MRLKINFPHVPTQRHSYLFNRENSLAPLSGCQDRLLREGARLASDQTQRLVKRQKQLKIFMNNAVSPSPVQCKRTFQCQSILLCCSPKSEFHRKGREEKLQQLEGACQKTLTPSSPSLSSVLEIKNWHGESHLHPPELREGRGRGVKGREVEGERDKWIGPAVNSAPRLCSSPKSWKKRREKDLQLDVLS